MESATGIEKEVCHDIALRQAIGIKKYGTTVAANPLTERQWAQHLYEELLDAAVYARRLIAEIDARKSKMPEFIARSTFADHVPDPATLPPTAGSAFD